MEYIMLDCVEENIFVKKPPFSSRLSFSSMPTREAVICLIGFYPGLSCVQLSKLIHRAKAKRISVQCVFKVLSCLLSEGVLIKSGRKYFINEDWIIDSKKFLEEFEERKSCLNKTMLFV